MFKRARKTGKSKVRGAIYRSPLSPTAKIFTERLLFFPRSFVQEDLSLSFSFFVSDNTLLVRDLRDELFFYEPSRAIRYFDGVEGVFTTLKKRYFPDDIFVPDVAGATILDVGANVGEFSLLCSKLGAARIFAFEPDPVAYRCLLKNLDRISEKASAFNVVLHEKEGKTVFYHSPKSADSSFIEPTKYERTDFIMAHRLDRYIDDFGNDRLVIKIEAEGGEPEVLRGAQKLIERGNVFLTIRASAERKGESTMPSCRKILEEFGCNYIVAKDGKQLLSWSPDLAGPRLRTY